MKETRPPQRSRFKITASSLLLPVVVTLVSVAAAAFAASGVANASAYCQIQVPAMTDCANVSGHSNTYQNVKTDLNEAQQFSATFYNVCEHTYQIGGGNTIDRVCGGSNEYNAVQSTAALCIYYDEPVAISDHVGDDASIPFNVTGYADTDDEFGAC